MHACENIVEQVQVSIFLLLFSGLPFQVCLKTEFQSSWPYFLMSGMF